MMQIIEQTDEEKMAMYMKMPKKKLAEMLIQCNKVLDTQYRGKVFSSNAVLTEGLPSENCPKCGKECYGRSCHDCQKYW